jgi:hypothetical protein
MLATLVDVLFGCWHKNYSFPITVRGGQRRNAAAQRTGTYVVCLDCGQEFAYDWSAMKVVSGGFDRGEALATAESLATK